MIQTLETVLGASVKVLVALKIAEEVTFKYNFLTSSVAPSAIVAVASASELKQSLVPRPKASATSSKFVFVEVPQFPYSYHVLISFNLKSLT